MPLFSFAFPGSTSIVYSYIIELANFKIIPTDWVIEKLTGVVNSARRSKLFYSGNYLFTIGFIVLLFFAAVLLYFLITFLRRFIQKQRKLSEFFQAIKNEIAYNFFIRTVISSYLLVAISAFKFVAKINA